MRASLEAPHHSVHRSKGYQAAAHSARSKLRLVVLRPTATSKSWATAAASAASPCCLRGCKLDAKVVAQVVRKVHRPTLVRACIVCLGVVTAIFSRTTCKAVTLSSSRFATLQQLVSRESSEFSQHAYDDSSRLRPLAYCRLPVARAALAARRPIQQRVGRGHLGKRGHPHAPARSLACLRTLPPAP